MNQGWVHRVISSISSSFGIFFRSPNLTEPSILSSEPEHLHYITFFLPYFLQCAPRTLSHSRCVCVFVSVYVCLRRKTSHPSSTQSNYSNLGRFVLPDGSGGPTKIGCNGSINPYRRVSIGRQAFTFFVLAVEQSFYLSIFRPTLNQSHLKVCRYKSLVENFFPIRSDPIRQILFFLPQKQCCQLFHAYRDNFF